MDSWLTLAGLPNVAPEGSYWDSIGQTWQEESPQALWRAHSDAVNRALLSRWLSPHVVGRLLKTDLFDEVAGQGLIDSLLPRARRVSGVDVSSEIVSAARRRHPDLEAIVADVRALPFADGSFDVVVSNSTLDHFRTRQELATALRELHRVLRPDGELLLTLDNLVNPLIALRNVLPFPLLHRLGLVPYYVGATCGPSGTRRLLREAGFEVLATDAVLHCPRVLAVALAGALEQKSSERIERRFLQGLMAFEHLSRWPTRFLTGYYVAMRAARC